MRSGRPLVDPRCSQPLVGAPQSPRWRDLANPHKGSPSTCGAGALDDHGTPAVYAWVAFDACALSEDAADTSTGEGCPEGSLARPRRPSAADGPRAEPMAVGDPDRCPQPGVTSIGPLSSGGEDGSSPVRSMAHTFLVGVARTFRCAPPFASIRRQPRMRRADLTGLFSLRPLVPNQAKLLSDDQIVPPGVISPMSVPAAAEQLRERWHRAEARIRLFASECCSPTQPATSMTRWEPSAARSGCARIPIGRNRPGLVPAH